MGHADSESFVSGVTLAAGRAAALRRLQKKAVGQ